MKEETVTVGDWEWCIDDEARLVPWFHICSEVEKKFTVKQTDTTRVFRAQDSRGCSYYVKHEIPASIKEHLIAWFSSRTKELYESAQILKDAGIPCADYPGWGKSGTESIILSVEIPDTMTALEYWFRVVPQNSAFRREFLSNLTALVALYVRKSIVQRDLTLENILIKNDGSELFVINPCSVEHCPDGLSREDSIALLKPLVEMRGEISPETATIAILDSGIMQDSLEASELWHDAVQAEEEEIESDSSFDDTESGSLDDSGPLFRIVRDGENVIRVRNTIWHAEIPLPDDSNSVAETVSAEDAEKIWTDSFKAQLMRELLPRVPLSWEQRADGSHVIRYAETEEGILDSGFDQ